jgi:hypothetical protein
LNPSGDTCERLFAEYAAPPTKQARQLHDKLNNFAGAAQ